MMDSTWPNPTPGMPPLARVVTLPALGRRLRGMGSVARRHAVLGAVALGLSIDVTVARAQASPPDMTLGREVQVSLERGRIPHLESDISVDPRDPQHLLVASVTLAEDRVGSSCSSPWCSPVSTGFVSFDGGDTWSWVPLEGCENLDPRTAIDAAGNAYVSCLYDFESTPGRWVMGVALLRSRDGGRSFSTPTIVPVGAGSHSDYPLLAVDTTNGPRAGSLYVVRGQSFLMSEGRYWFGPSIVRSLDAGESFLEPGIQKINNLDNWPSDFGLLPNGDLAVLYVEIPRPNGVIPVQDLQRIYTLGLRDPRVSDARSWVIVSEDGGDTFGPPSFVAEHPVTAFAVDSSERFFGRWYVAMSATLSFEGEAWTFEEGSPSEVFVMYSDDSGQSWSTPSRVSDSGRSTLVNRVMMGVNRDGTVGVAWYDGRNGTAEDCYDVYFSLSIDGGDTFADNRRLSSVTSCQDVPGNVVFGPTLGAQGELVDPDGERDIAARWPLGGDYSGFAVGPDGRFHVVWADSRTGVYQLWTRSVISAGR